MENRKGIQMDHAEKPAAGEDLVVVGTIGQMGSRVLLEAKKELLSQRFSTSYLRGILEFQEPKIKKDVDWLEEEGITAREPVGEGGIFRAIWNLSSKPSIGIAFRLRHIPIRQHTIELCEQCGCNPYRLWCGNCLLLTVKNGGQFVENRSKQGFTAAVIGRVTEGTARVILHGNELGYLERPREDEIYRLLGEDADNLLLKICTKLPCCGKKEQDVLSRAFKIKNGGYYERQNSGSN